MNGIKQIFSSAYHPSLNGADERLVQTVKSGLNVWRNITGIAEVKLRQFLVNNRSTPVTTTGLTPRELFLGRRIRPRIKQIKSNLQIKMISYGKKEIYNHQVGCQRMRQFSIGNKVFIRNYLLNLFLLYYYYWYILLSMIMLHVLMGNSTVQHDFCSQQVIVISVNAKH